MDNEALVRHAIDVLWNHDDLDAADEMFGADYVNHNGLIPDLIRGPEAIKIAVVMCRLAFSDLHITVENSTADGETVVIQWVALQRRSSADGSAIDATLLRGSTRCRLSAGKIVETWTEW